jgi:hypothetical protein
MGWTSQFVMFLMFISDPPFVSCRSRPSRISYWAGRLEFPDCCTGGVETTGTAGWNAGGNALFGVIDGCISG